MTMLARIMAGAFLALSFVSMSLAQGFGPSGGGFGPSSASTFTGGTVSNATTFNNQETFNFGATQGTSTGAVEWRINPIYSDTTTGTYNFGHAWFANGFSVTRPNEIYSWGYNISSNQQALNTNDDSFYEATETNYAQDATHFLMEHHVSARRKDTQAEVRIRSIGIEKGTSANPYRVNILDKAYDYQIQDPNGNIRFEFDNSVASAAQFAVIDGHVIIQNKTVNDSQIIFDQQRTGFDSYILFKYLGGSKWSIQHDGGGGSADLWIVDNAASNAVNFRFNHSGGASVGTGTVATASGEFGITKITASASAPGAGTCKISAVAGTNANTCKLIAYCGTSGTAATILDNIGTGC